MRILCFSNTAISIYFINIWGLLFLSHLAETLRKQTLHAGRPFEEKLSEEIQSSLQLRSISTTGFSRRRVRESLGEEVQSIQRTQIQKLWWAGKQISAQKNGSRWAIWVQLRSKVLQTSASITKGSIPVPIQRASWCVLPNSAKSEKLHRSIYS